MAAWLGVSIKAVEGHLKAKRPRPVVLKTALVIVAKLGAVTTVGLEPTNLLVGVGFISAYAVESSQKP